jgi:hypothetical protein
MAEDFNPDLPVVVAKEFSGYDERVKKSVTFQPGTLFDWKAIGVKEERVGAMVRTRYLRHSTAPQPRVARKQAARNEAGRAKAPAKPAKAAKAAHSPARRARKG